jgi:tetratricopeptide (TPR) repeat protein/energy-coupling factor transporter ATP-binding protein EcfA2
MNTPAGSQDFPFQIDEFYLDLQTDGSKLCLLSEEEIQKRPFPGLRPFRTSEFQLFRGRTGQAEELITRLKKNNFLAVIGSSGTGKSSLIRAGLIPQLFGGYLHEAGGKWNIAICRPGKDPVENLAIALSGIKSQSKDKEWILESYNVIEPVLRHSIYGVLEIKQLLNDSAPAGEHSNLLIIIDQFEELFRFDRKDLEQKNIENHFVNLLLKATAKAESQIYVIITMRSEFLGDCVKYRGLAEAINEGQFLVPQLGRTQLKEVIEGPIFLAKAKISSGLVELLINKIEESKLKNNLDQLPILQHALMRTYNEAMSFGAGTEIDFIHYESIGGLEKALANHAEIKYNELGDEGSTGPSKKQRITKMIFQALTEQSTEQKGGRNPTELKKMHAIAEAINATPEEVNEVTDHFRDPYTSFIMPPNNTILYGGLMIDISHESLMRNWERLSEWIKEESADARLYSLLNDRREEAEQEQDKDSWIKGILLRELLKWDEKQKYNAAWAERYTRDKQPGKESFEKNRAFLYDSKREYDNGLASEKSDIEKKVKEKQRVKSAKMISWISGIAAGISLIFVAFAFIQRSKAMEQRNIAIKKSFESEIKDSSWYRNKLVDGYKTYIIDTLFELYSKKTNRDSLAAGKMVGSLALLEEAYGKSKEDWGIYLHLLLEARNFNRNYITRSIFDSVLGISIPFQHRYMVNSAYGSGSAANKVIVKFIYGDRNNAFIMGNSDGFFKYSEGDSSGMSLLLLDYNSKAAAISDDTKKLVSYDGEANTFRLYTRGEDGLFHYNDLLDKLDRSFRIQVRKNYSKYERYSFAAAFSPDNNLLATYVQSKYGPSNCLIYHLDQHKVDVLEFKENSNLLNMSFCNDNRKVIICFPDSLLVLNIDNPGAGKIVIFSPNSKQKDAEFSKALFSLKDSIVAVYNKKIYKWSSNGRPANPVITGRETRNIFAPRGTALSSFITDKGEDQDGQYINLLAKPDTKNKLFAWHNNQIKDIDISENGRFLISADNKEIYVWKLGFSDIHETDIAPMVSRQKLTLLYREKGDSSYGKGNLKDAMANYKRLLPFVTDDHPLFNKIGLTYYKLEVYDSAVEYFKKAVKLDSTDKVYLCNLGYTYILQGQYGKAIAVLKKSYAIDSTYAVDRLALAYYHLRNYRTAIELYKRSLSIDSSDATAFENLGASYYHSNSLDSSIAVLNKSLKLNDSSSNTWNLLGLNFQAKRDYTQALKYLKKARSLAPKDDVILSNLSAYYIATRDYTQAITYADSSIALDAKESRPYASRGLGYLRLKNFDKALKDITESIRLDSTDYKNHLCLAAYYASQNQRQLALSYLEKTVKNASTRAMVDLSWFQRYESFPNIGNDPNFIKLLAKLEKQSDHKK